MVSRGVTYQITDMGMVNGERMFEINYSDGSSSCLIISKSYVCCKKTDAEGEKSISFVDISGINEQVSENSSISIKTASASSSLAYGPKTYDKYKQKFYYQLVKSSDNTRQYYLVGNGSTSSLINITKKVPGALSDYRATISKVNANYNAMVALIGIGSVATVVGILLACATTDGAAAIIVAVLGIDVADAIAVVTFGRDLIEAYDSLALKYINAANCGTKQ